jgi:hypothetical protein
MVARERLTILTDPVPAGAGAIGEWARRGLRWTRDRVHPPPDYHHRSYRGHFAVTRSAVEGMKAIGVDAAYNPTSLRGVAEHVVVLSGVAALRQAIGWKREGRIRRLLAGPNIVNLPSDAGAVLCAPEIDVVITPSRHVLDLYVDDCPELRGRCTAWPAGVDVGFWTPEPAERAEPRLLFYAKPQNWDGGSVESYRELVARRGFGIIDVQYGAYRPAGYREALRRSTALVAFVNAESQGLAWAEAWACDVPTLICHRDSTEFRNSARLSGRRVPTSPAPYLSPATGRLFRDLQDFDALVQELEQPASPFTPRAWAVEHMSDEACARQLHDLACSAA